MAKCVQAIVGSSRSSQPVFERRRATRYPYPYPIRLIPVSRDGSPRLDESMFVLGKLLSPHGLDFYAPNPIPYRRAITCFDCGSDREMQLLMDLTWCRFCRHGWYDNGGRFLEEVSLADIDRESSLLSCSI